MANREISQFASLAAGSQSPTMILPIVDTSLGHVAAANKQVTLNALFFDLGLNTSDGAVSMTGLLAAPSASSAGKLKWYYNNSTKQWLASIDTGSYYSVQRSIAAGLTAGWLPYVDTGGILNGSANATLDGNGSLFCKFVTIQSALAGLNSVAEINDSTGTDRWEIRLGASNQLIIQDFQNSKDVITLTPGATPVVQLNGTLRWLTDNSQDIGLVSSGRARTAYIGTSVIIGRSSNTTGVLTFNNSTNTNQTSFQAGAAATSRTYTWPTDFGAAGSVLTDAAGNGTLSWTAAAGITGSIAATQIAYGSGTNTITGDNNLEWDSTNKRMIVGFDVSNYKYIYTDSSGFLNLSRNASTAPAVIIGGGNSELYIRSTSTGGLLAHNGTHLKIDSLAAGGGVYLNSSSATGGVQVGVSVVSGLAASLGVGSLSSTTIGQIIKLAAAQTASGFELQDSSSNKLVTLNSDGSVSLTTSGTGANTNYRFSVTGTSKNTVYFGLVPGSNAAASDTLYYYAATVTGGLTIFGGQVSATGTVESFIYNNSSTSNADARHEVRTNTSSGGNPYFQFTVSGVVNFSAGLHNSDSQIFKMGFMTNPSSGLSALMINQAGVVLISTATNNKDTGLARNAAGILEINNGTAGTFRDLRARYIGIGLAPTSGVLNIGGASQSGAYISVSTSSQVANDKLISVSMAGSITGTLYAADISMTATVNVLTRITNTENATATSNCELQLVTGGASGGDPFIHFNISGNTDWSIGARNTDSDNLTITAASDLSTSVILKVTTAGAFTVIDGSTWNVGTTTGLKLGTSGGASGQKLGFFNATPIVQPLLATGAGATVDNVITVLQNLGLCRQT